MKNNECDMFVELSVWGLKETEKDGRESCFLVTYVPNCKESFILNIDTYLKDLKSEKDDLIVWESKHKIDRRRAVAWLIKQGNYKLNNLVICNERYSDFRVEEE